MQRPAILAGAGFDDTTALLTYASGGGSTLIPLVTAGVATVGRFDPPA